MKITRVELKDFMIFESLSVDWSPNINVISGGNSTGKTALIKVMYSLLAALFQVVPKPEPREKTEAKIVDKMTHVFRPENLAIGRLVRRKQGGNRAEGSIFLQNLEKAIRFGFGNRAEKRIDLDINGLNIGFLQGAAVYFPPKEIISSIENFRSLYEDMHIAFEETYNDLARYLDRPLKKGENTSEQQKVIDSLGSIMKGSIIQKENKFYLSVLGKDEYEMGLVSEGYRKLATIVYLICNGVLNKRSILFWDEPEANMNPKMIGPLVEAVMELAKMGVQVFITTHDYFIQQYFNMYMAFPETNPSNIDIRFMSLFKNDKSDAINSESASVLSDLEHNTIMEEFDEIYNREQGIIYDRIRG